MSFSLNGVKTRKSKKMEINKISPSFGKKSVMKCVVKDKRTEKNNSATLYKLDSNDSSDVRDVFFSKNTAAIGKDILRDNKSGKSNSDYFVLCNDDNGEVISCAQTQHRYRITPQHEGQYTLIKSLGENRNYSNPVVPLIGYIVKTASDRYDKNVFAAYTLDERPVLEKINFTEDKHGETFIPSEKFDSVLNGTKEHFSINFEC